MEVDLRSDTLTRPTPGMLDAMFSAQVGDDVYGEDPTVHALQEKSAELFGMDSALFCPSGTMCNQIGIRLGTEPQSEVICDKRSHIYLYEAGGIAANSLASVRLLDGNRGKITTDQILENVNPADMHFSNTSMVSLENTVNKGGGAIYTLREISAISEVCRTHGLSLHIDGARLFNALVETGEDPSEYGRYCDTISFCLSKGLGAPVGSILLLKKEKEEKAKRIRKTMGGSMRQAGYLAAAGIYALDNHVQKLKADHEKAKQIGTTLENLEMVKEVMPVETNIIIFKHDHNWKSQGDLLNHLNDKGIKASPFGPSYIRFVTHLDISDNMLEYTIEVLSKLN